MKISTKGRYALRLMIDLGENNTGTPISLRDVAKRQGISEKYLEQIISDIDGLTRIATETVSLIDDDILDALILLDRLNHLLD